MRYLPAVGAPFGVEVLSFARLRELDRDGRRTRLQRPDFHVLALVASGTGSHVADFESYHLRRGSALWIRPGTVHRWSDVDGLDGPLILFRPGFLPDLGPTAPDLSVLSVPPSWYVDAQTLPLALLAADHLREEHGTAVRLPRLASAPLLAHLLAALVLRVLPATSVSDAADPARRAGVFVAFRAAVEEHFADRHHVADYARALGYDRRTLTRATRAATGVGAKEFLDQRILLEAKRLLAHTDMTVGGCARALGFGDAANFTTFFHRGAGMPPGAWRSHVADGATVLARVSSGAARRSRGG